MDRPNIKAMEGRLEDHGDLNIGEPEVLIAYIRHLEAAIVEWVDARDTVLHPHSMDMGGKHGYAIRIPQGAKGDRPRNADVALCYIAANIPTKEPSDE